MDYDELKNNISYLTKDVTALDILLQCEKILEESGVYAYENWESGEVVKGPNIERHWVELTLMYPKKLMPEPVGALRLTTLGAKVFYSRDKFKVPVRVKGPEDISDPVTKKAKSKLHHVWLVKICIPKRLVDQEIQEYTSIDDIDFDVSKSEIDDAYDGPDNLDVVEEDPVNNEGDDLE